MGNQPTALAASGGSQRTLPEALAASGGGNGGRQTSGRRWKPTQRSGRQWRRQWRPTIIWPSLETDPTLCPPVEAAMAADNHLAVDEGHPSALAARGGSQGTLPDLSLPLEAAMGDQPNALAASGGSQGTLPDALAASGGGHGGRQSSGRHRRPSFGSGCP